MFFYYLFSAYTIPCLYLYFRIYHLLIPKGWKIVFSMLFLVLYIAFPTAEMLSHNEGKVIAPLLKLGYYTMPFMLYLFLLVLLFDLLLLFNFLFRWLPAGFIRHSKFRRLGLIIVVVVPALVVVYGIINFSTIRISDYKVEIPFDASDTHEVSLAFISDFHIGDLTNMRFIERFAKILNSIEPDLILFGGDLLEGDRDKFKTSQIESLFRQLEAPYGIYGVYGNHEHHGGGGSSTFYKNAGIHLLNDTSVMIKRIFYLVGRKDARDRNRLSIEDLLEKLPDNYPIVLLDHQPREIQSAVDNSVDIQLSGHTHHGQLFPFNLISKKIHDISWGHKKIGNTHFFVSSGIQLWGPPVRTVAKSEIMRIHVTFSPRSKSEN